MAKNLFLTAALLVAVVGLATATTTTYTTVVTTTSFDEANQGGQQGQCSQQVEGRQWQSCQRYLSQQSRGKKSPWSGEQDEIVEMVTRNQGSQQEWLRNCCQELRNVDEQCQCEAVRHIARQAQQQQKGGQSQQVYQRVRELPRRCNLQSEQCQFHVLFV